MSVGPGEIGLILLVVFLLFGARRLGDLGKGIGDGIRGFKLGIAGESEESDRSKGKPSEPPLQQVDRVASSEELGNVPSSLSLATVEMAECETAHVPGKPASESAEPLT